MLASDLDFSHVSDEDLSEAYRSTGQRLKGSPLYKEFGSLIDQYFNNPADDPGLRDFLNQAHQDVADSTFFLKQKKSKADLGAMQLKNADDGELYAVERLARTATNEGWARTRKNLQENMPPDIWASIEHEIPLEASKEVRARFREILRSEKTGSKAASIQEFEYMKGELQPGEKGPSYREWMKIRLLRPDRDKVSPTQALGMVRSVEGETKSRLDWNGDLNDIDPEMTFPQGVRYVARERGWDMDNLYALSMGQKPGAAPEAAVETRTDPNDGKVYEKGADGLWLEKK